MIDLLKKADDLKRLIAELGAAIPEETAAAFPAVWPEWEEGTHYKKDQYCTFGENAVGDPQAYRVLKTTKATTASIPGTDAGAEYYKPIGLSESGWPVWVQPASNKDAYDKGDVVDCDGTLYQSAKKNNTDDPRDATGTWELYTLPEPDPDQPELQYPEWVQPADKKAAYNKGDIVSREGVLYISIKNNNMDDPMDATGTWELYTLPEPDPDQPELQYPEWVQPADKKAAYNKGDIVSREGVLYISIKNNNMDDPMDATGTWATFTPASEVAGETV